MNLNRKPFDVRQAMFDRPNEWVGAYRSQVLDQKPRWIKLAFRTDMMQAVSTHDWDRDLHSAWCSAYRYELDGAIPIEDVPEEATQ